MCDGPGRADQTVTVTVPRQKLTLRPDSEAPALERPRHSLPVVPGALTAAQARAFCSTSPAVLGIGTIRPAGDGG